MNIKLKFENDNTVTISNVNRDHFEILMNALIVHHNVTNKKIKNPEIPPSEIEKIKADKVTTQSLYHALEQSYKEFDTNHYHEELTRI